MKRILILGGTEFFGPEIVKLFHSRDFEVAVYTRGNSYPLDFPPVERIVGDRGDVEKLKEVGKRDWEIVIDNLAYNATDVTNCLAALPSIKHYLLTSTVSVYKFSKCAYGVPLREDDLDYSAKPADEDPNDIHWSYARGKLEAEKALVAQNEVPWTIFRPSIIYGPNDPKARGFWYLGRMQDGKPILLPNAGAASMRLTFSKDIAQAYLKAVENRKAVARAYNVAQAEIITLKDFLTESAKCMELEPKWVAAPQTWLGELGGPHGEVSNVIPCIERITEELGFVPTPFEVFVRETTKWYRENYPAPDTSWLATREMELRLAEKIQTEYAVLSK